MRRVTGVEEEVRRCVERGIESILYIQKRQEGVLMVYSVKWVSVFLMS